MKRCKGVVFVWSKVGPSTMRGYLIWGLTYSVSVGLALLMRWAELTRLLKEGDFVIIRGR